METRKIILTRGIPGSGKSTWAKKWVNEDPEHRIRFNWDDIRNMMGPYWVINRENTGIMKSLRKTFLEKMMCEKWDIVIDNMNLNFKEYEYYNNVVNYYNKNFITQYVLEFKDFFISVEECISRDALRQNPIGEKTIREIWKKYRHFIQTTNIEKYVNNLVKPDPDKPYCVVIDMDSTMCFNTNKRPWYGKGAAEEMINDIENFGVCKTVLVLMQEYPIIVATGRDTSQEEVTKQWLSQHKINPIKYYFRTEGDHRKVTEVKKEQIEKILKDYNILVIFEDSEPIVKMYRDMGLTVLQPNKGL